MNYYQLETASQELVRERLDHARRDHLARQARPQAGRLGRVLANLGCALLRREPNVALALR